MHGVDELTCHASEATEDDLRFCRIAATSRGKRREPRPKPGLSISVRDEDSAALLRPSSLPSWRVPSWRVPSWLGPSLLPSWLPSWRGLLGGCLLGGCLLGGCLLGGAFLRCLLGWVPSGGCLLAGAFFAVPSWLGPSLLPSWLGPSSLPRWGLSLGVRIGLGCRYSSLAVRGSQRNDPCIDAARSSSKRCTTKSRVSPTATASRARRGAGSPRSRSGR